jgi:hypothetical protein
MVFTTAAQPNAASLGLDSCYTGHVWSMKSAKVLDLSGQSEIVFTQALRSADRC